MPVNDPKIHVLNAMMGNPKISRMISDAWKSPIGSTKRKQVKSIVSSINKISAKRFNSAANDGEGGPGVGPGSGIGTNVQASAPKIDYLPYSTSRPDSYDRLVIMPSAPNMVSDGKGGPAAGSASQSAIDGLATQSGRQLIPAGQEQFYYPNSIVKEPNSANSYGVPMPTGDVGYKPLTPEQSNQKGLIGNAYNWLTGYAAPTAEKNIGLGVLSGVAGAEAGVKDIGAAFQNAGSALFGTDAIQPTQYTSPSDTMSGKIIGSMTSPHGAPGATPAASATPYNPWGSPSGTTSSWGPETTPSWDPWQQQTQANASTTTPSAVSGTGTAGSTDTTGSTASKYGVSSDLLARASGDTTSGLFVNDIMSAGLPALRKLFPGMADDQLPHGASLAGQVNDLQNRLKEEDGLNTSLALQTAAVNKGQTLAPDLTSYIQGKDQYLAGIDKMISDTQTTINKAGDDPTVARQMGNYVNYLYVLKGRQTARYTDFLNTSVQQQTNNITQAQNMYTQAQSLYSSDLASQTAITQEDFTKWQGILTDTWNAVHTQTDPTALANLNKTNSETALNQANAAKVAIDAANAGSGSKFWEQETKYNSHFIDTKATSTTEGEILPGINIADQMLWAIGPGNNYDIQGVSDVVANGIAKKINSSTPYATIKDLGNQLYDVASKVNTSVGYTIAKGMYDKSIASITKYITDNSSAFQHAISDLAPAGGFMGSVKPMPEKEWLDRYSNAQGWGNTGKLDKTMLTDIYSYFMKNFPQYSDPTKSRGLFTTDPSMAINDSTMPTIAANIANSLVAYNMDQPLYNNYVQQANSASQQGSSTVQPGGVPIVTPNSVTYSQPSESAPAPAPAPL